MVVAPAWSRSSVAPPPKRWREPRPAPLDVPLSPSTLRDPAIPHANPGSARQLLRRSLGIERVEVAFALA